jgi:hypothetical protein
MVWLYSSLCNEFRSFVSKKIKIKICSGAREREEVALHCSLFALIPFLAPMQLWGIQVGRYSTYYAFRGHALREGRLYQHKVEDAIPVRGPVSATYTFGTNSPQLVSAICDN